MPEQQATPTTETMRDVLRLDVMQNRRRGETEPVNENQLTHCERCFQGTDTPARVVTRVTRNSTDNISQNYCRSCNRNNAFTCGRCESRFINILNFSGFCEPCYERQVECGTCGMRRDLDTCIKRRGYWCCRECLCKVTIYDYGYKPTPVLFGTVGPYYGVELELSFDEDQAATQARLQRIMTGLSGTPSNWDVHAYLKTDSSVDNGVEIVTHPHTLAEHRVLWNGFFDMLEADNEMDLSGEKNGMHVHMPRFFAKSAEREEQVGLAPLVEARVDVFLNRFRTFTEHIAGRSSGQWAKLDARKKLTAERGDRYSGLNRTGSVTAEMRIFRGTTDRATFFKNLEFCDALAAYCAITPEKDSAQAKGLNVEDFCRFVRAGGSKAWPYLDAWLVRKGYLPARKQKTMTAGA